MGFLPQPRTLFPMLSDLVHVSLPLVDVLSAGASAVKQPIFWADLGLKKGISLGFFTLRFYSLAYLAGIVFGYWHMTRMIRQPGSPLAQRHVDDLFFWCTLGIILGGRLGYATFYDHTLYTEPLKMLRLWEGGMSFHGGLIGVLVAVWGVCRAGGLSFIRVMDYVAPCAPVGLFFGALPISSMANCGAGWPGRTCLGRWFFPTRRPAISPATPASSMKRALRV